MKHEKPGVSATQKSQLSWLMFLITWNKVRTGSFSFREGIGERSQATFILNRHTGMKGDPMHGPTYTINKTGLMS